MKNIAIYIHWPFCKSKCPYCDFNSHVRDSIDSKQWFDAYRKEIRYYQDFLSDKSITSIFFGGGTPSLMPIPIVEMILQELSSIGKFDPDIEITLEANPTSIEMKKFSDLALAGVNRISIGIQSFNEKDLKFLGREHSVKEALDAIEIASKYFSNFSFDLIYALPDQTLDLWEKELNFALDIAKYHISLYQLTIEKGTRFYSDFQNKKFTLPSNDSAAEFYELTEHLTTQKGLHPYEISNYSKPGFESKHNLTYWKYEEYLGLGAGAHSRITDTYGLKAIMNYHLPEKWLQDIEQKGSSIQTQEILQTEDIIQEFLLMNLRLKQGLDKKHFQGKIGINLENILDPKKLSNLENGNFLINTPEKIVLTFQGKLLLNQVIKFLL